MKPIFICFLFFYLWNLSAQQIVVVDETNSEPITGVAVFNLFKTKTDISDFDGKVSLVRFQSFERVYFQHISYHKESMLKSKVSDTIFLSPKSTDLNEIVISASKFEQTRKEVPQKIISINSLDIQRSSPQTSADLLANSGRVFEKRVNWAEGVQ